VWGMMRLPRISGFQSAAADGRELVELLESATDGYA
jgi:hypothetical protein